MRCFDKYYFAFYYFTALDIVISTALSRREHFIYNWTIYIFNAFIPLLENKKRKKAFLFHLNKCCHAFWSFLCSVSLWNGTICCFDNLCTSNSDGRFLSMLPLFSPMGLGTAEKYCGREDKKLDLNISYKKSVSK